MRIGANPIFWWTLQSVAVAAILAGLAWLACRWRRLGPAARHALWLVVLIKLVTPPLLAWPWAAPNWFASLGESRDEERKTVVATPIPSGRTTTIVSIPELKFGPAKLQATSRHVTQKIADLTPSQVPFVAPVTANITHRPRVLLPVLAAIWIGGSVLFTLVQIARVTCMSAKLRRSSPPTGALCRLARELARRIGVRYVEPRVVAGIDSPLVFALFRPRLLWPRDGACDDDEVAVRTLLVHELAHLKRRDHWVGWLELLAGVVWWWNPLYWYVRHQLRENAELACDAWVVGTLPGGRRAYAEALLAVCERMSAASSTSSSPWRTTDPMPALGVGTAGRRFLERRLTMIIRDHVPFRLPRTALLAVALLGLVSVPAWSQRAPATTDDFIFEGGNGKPPVQKGKPNPGIELHIADPTGRGVPPAVGGAAAALPPEAQEILDRLKKQSDEARDRLRGLADAYAATGRPGEAAAIRSAIEGMTAGPATGGGDPRPLGSRRDLRGRLLSDFGGGDIPDADAQPTPPTMAGFRGAVGQTFAIEVTGTTEGAVWGTDVYTDDSVVAAAAVHAGIVKPGEHRIVQVKVLAGAPAYKGSTRNGVTTNDYRQWEGSYRFEADAPPGGGAPPAATPGDGNGGNAIPAPEPLLRLPGGPAADAAPTAPGAIPKRAPRLRILTPPAGGPPATPGAAAPAAAQVDATAGVTTLKVRDQLIHARVMAADADLAARIDDDNPNDPNAAPPAGARPDNATPAQFRGRNGLTVLFDVVGTNQGTIWGDGTYTDDSPIAVAAVHAGLLTIGQRGTVLVTIAPGREEYAGITRNGITSNPYKAYGGSYTIRKADVVRADHRGRLVEGVIDIEPAGLAPAAIAPTSPAGLSSPVEVHR